MDEIDFSVDSDIKKARTIAKEVYTSPKIFEQEKERIFKIHWQLLTDIDAVKIPGQYYVCDYLEPTIEEPLIFTRDTEDAIHCFSNVCKKYPNNPVS